MYHMNGIIICHDLNPRFPQNPIKRACPADWVGDELINRCKMMVSTGAREVQSILWRESIPLSDDNIQTQKEANKSKEHLIYIIFRHMFDKQMRAAQTHPVLAARNAAVQKAIRTSLCMMGMQNLLTRSEIRDVEEEYDEDDEDEPFTYVGTISMPVNFPCTRGQRTQQPSHSPTRSASL